MDQLASQWRFICELPLFNFAHNANGAQAMLIYSIAVIHIKLHHPDNAAKIWHINTQPARFIHQPQYPFRIALATDDLQEHLMCLFGLKLQGFCCPYRTGQPPQGIGMNIQLMNKGEIK